MKDFVIALLTQARQLVVQQDFKAAQSVLSDVLEQEPDCDLPELYLYMGVVQTNLQCVKDASQCFDKAIALKPNFIEAYVQRGDLKGMTGDYGGALADYHTALELGGASPQIFCNCGLVLMYMGQTEEALQNYGNAIVLEPRFTNAYLNRAHAYASLQQYGKALEDIEIAIKLEPQNSNAYCSKAIIETNMGRIDQAIQDFQFSLSLDPSNQITAQYLCQLLSSK